MVQPHRHSIVDRSLTRVHHYCVDRSDEFSVKGGRAHTLWGLEGLAYPFVGYVGGVELRIPGEAAEQIPVGLGEDIAAEILVLTGVCHTCDTLDHTGDG